MLSDTTGRDSYVAGSDPADPNRRRGVIAAAGVAAAGVGLAGVLAFAASPARGTRASVAAAAPAASAPASTNPWVSTATIPTPDGHSATAHAGRTGPALPMPTVTNNDAGSQAASRSWAPRVAAVLSGYEPKRSSSAGGDGGPTVTTAEFGDGSGTVVTVSSQQLQAPVPLAALTFGSGAGSEKTLPDGMVVVDDLRGLPYTAGVYAVNRIGAMVTVTVAGDMAHGQKVDVTVGQLESLAEQLVR